jgi:hypothetical protein
MALDRVANDLYKTIAVFDPEDPSGIPLLKLDKSALDFGRISYVMTWFPGAVAQRLIYSGRYATPVTQTLRIHNAGKVTESRKSFPLPCPDTKSRFPLHSVSSHAISAPQSVCHITFNTPEC